MELCMNKELWQKSGMMASAYFTAVDHFYSFFFILLLIKVDLNILNIVTIEV